MRIWSTNAPPGRPSAIVKTHDAEVLSCDWCKHEPNLLATAGSDGLIRGWDLRHLLLPVFEQKVKNLL